MNQRRIIKLNIFIFILVWLLALTGGHPLQAQDREVPSVETIMNTETDILPPNVSVTLDFRLMPGSLTASGRPQGVAWVNGTFWSALEGSPAQMVNLDLNGNTLNSFNLPDGLTPGGVDYDGQNLWIMDSQTNKAHYYTTSGELIRTINLPEGSYPGLAWDGSSLWTADWGRAFLYEIDPQSGVVLTTQPTAYMASATAYGLAFDNNYLWVSNSEGIYQLDVTNGAVYETHSTPFDQGTSMGLTWSGTDLWGSGGTSNNIIQLDVSGGTVTRAPPAVTTGGSDVYYTDATIYGYVNPNGLSTDVYFEIGRSTSLSFRTQSINIGSSFDTMIIWASFYGLDYDTRYYYRIVARNSMGTRRGSILSFHTDDYWDNWWVGGDCFLDSILKIRP